MAQTGIKVQKRFHKEPHFLSRSCTVHFHFHQTSYNWTENLVMLSALAWPPLSNPRGFHMVASLPCRKQMGAVAAHMLCYKDCPLKKVPASCPWDDPLLLLPTEDPDLKYPCSHSPKTEKCSVVLRCLDSSWLINKAVF